MAKSPTTEDALRQREANKVDEHVGGRMRKRRLQLGMSQERLAELLGVTFQQVQKYEKGVNRIAASRLYKAGHALDVPFQYFVKGLPASGIGKR